MRFVISDQRRSPESCERGAGQKRPSRFRFVLVKQGASSPIQGAPSALNSAHTCQADIRHFTNIVLQALVAGFTAYPE